MFANITEKLDKELLDPKLSEILKEMTKICETESSPHNDCILNNPKVFIEEHSVKIEELPDGQNYIKTTEEKAKELLDKIRPLYVKSCALQIFADNESIRIYKLVKSLGAKISVGVPGSHESIAFDLMIGTLAHNIPLAVKEFILTEGHTEVSAKVKIENALKIATQFNLDLSEPTQLELTKASFSLKRPDISAAIDAAMSSCKITAHLYDKTQQIKNSLKYFPYSGYQKLTWGYSKLKQVADNNKPLLFSAAAASIPLIYSAIQLVAGTDDCAQNKAAELPALTI